MIVVDTSALVGAWHAHYRPGAMGGFWRFLDQRWAAGQLVIPSLVFEELAAQSTDVHEWVKARKGLLVEPDSEVQKTVGELVGRYRFKVGHDAADPFVIAEAKIRGFTVATYEGRSPTGSVARARKRNDNIPTICATEGVRCLHPGAAWEQAGLSL